MTTGFSSFQPASRKAHQISWQYEENEDFQMSIFGSMKTSVAGMNAQANRLSTVSDNIANVNTTGYKSASTAFSTLVLPSGTGNYNSGGVETHVERAISDQGDISYTTTTTNMAISGDGFFIVQDANGTPYLTRAGDFAPDNSGNLVNGAGYTLMGYSYDSGSPSVVVNGFTGLVPVNTAQSGLTAIASTSGTLTGNLNSNDAVVTGDTASDNTATSSYSEKSSVIAYDSQGNPVTYDVYFTKTQDTPADANDEWDVAVYNHADAASGSSPFPYANGPVGQTTMDFDASGNLISGGGSSGSFDISDPTNNLSISMDLTGFTQLAATFGATGNINGQAPSAVKSVTIGTDGVVSALYADGSSKPIYRIPLATVPSEDNLTPLSGNVFSANGDSGVTITGFPQSAQFGKIVSGAVEESNVDLAGQLTEMIEAQKNYTANSKVFQTGANLLDVLVNLAR
jgi:flagellar hook protein FlgE